MPDVPPVPPDLARYLATSTGLPQPTVARVIADVTAYFDETVEQFVRRRHAELRGHNHKNDEIWPAVAAELGQRRFTAPPASERQLRRMVYENKRERDNSVRNRGVRGPQGRDPGPA